MSATSLADLLASQLPKGLADIARKLTDAQTRVERALPAGCAGQVRVMQLQSGELHLACASGAVASRLRHQGDALLRELAANGLAVTSVHPHVKPELVEPWREPVVKQGIPESALDAFATLDRNVEAGPLKDALDSLLRNHRGG